MTLKPTDAASPLKRLSASVTAGSVIGGVTTAITAGELGLGGDATEPAASAIAHSPVATTITECGGLGAIRRPQWHRCRGGMPGGTDAPHRGRGHLPQSVAKGPFPAQALPLHKNRLQFHPNSDHTRTAPHERLGPSFRSAARERKQRPWPGPLRENARAEPIESDGRDHRDGYTGRHPPAQRGSFGYRRPYRRRCPFSWPARQSRRSRRAPIGLPTPDVEAEAARTADHDSGADRRECGAPGSRDRSERTLEPG